MQATTFARRHAVAGLAVISIALSACGGGSSGDEKEIKSTLNGVYDALAAKDAGKVCAALSASGRRQLTSNAPRSSHASCEQFLSVGLAQLGNAVRGIGAAKVTHVDVNGDKATATVEFRKQAGKVGLVKEGGKWKVNDLSVK